jgi:putative acetyltransferase
MIRPFQEKDLDAAAELWLNVNLASHNFIPADYFKDYYDALKQQLLQAEVYVAEENRVITGFIGLHQNHIEGLFVLSTYQNKGIGTALIRQCQEKYQTLSLYVYKKNQNAIAFYEKLGFHKEQSKIDAHTGQEEYSMVWNRS